MLVIGGAGTIGSSYIKAMLPFKPGKLVVADINENGLTELVRDCRSREDLQLPKDFKSYPVNFGDPVFKKIFINKLLKKVNHQSVIDLFSHEES